MYNKESRLTQGGIFVTVKANVTTEPQTMAELLKQEGVQLRGLHRGDVIEGVVTQISPRSLSLDIGAKTEGVVIDKEFAMARAMLRL